MKKQTLLILVAFVLGFSSIQLTAQCNSKQSHHSKVMIGGAVINPNQNIVSNNWDRLPLNFHR